MKKIDEIYEILKQESCNNTEFFLKKGFSAETSERFKLTELKNYIDIPEIKELYPEETKDFFTTYKYLVPAFDENGETDYLMIRRRDDYQKKEGIYIHKTLFIGETNRGLGKIYNPVRLIDNTDYVFIVESWTDALSLEELGIPAVAMNRVANCHTVLEPFVKKYSEIIQRKAIIVMCDTDEAGTEANRDISGMLTENGFKCLVYSDLPESIKDANEWLNADRNNMKRILEKYLKGI